MSSQVFIGGTGRSGTTAISHLIGHYPRHHRLDIEVKVHCAPGGLVDVVEGRADPQTFVDRVRGEWYFGGWEGGGRGLHWLHSGREVHRMCERFLARFEGDALEAGRLFLHELLDPLVPVDKDAWVEMTPLNALVLPQLGAWFPLAKFILAVRDGRDTVASVLAQPWGPTTWDEGLQWWAEGIRASHLGRQAVGQHRVLTIHLEHLVGDRGDEAQTALVEFLDLNDGEGARNFRRHRITPARANIGRWERDLDAEQRRSVQAKYDTLLAELASDGVTDLPGS